MMPKAFTEHEKQLIGARLLEQGHQQFAAYGLRKTTVEELAAGAGISKGAFYLFYPSKEALLMDVVEQAEQRFRQTVLAVVDQPGPSPHARLVTVLHEAFTLWKTIPVLQIFTRGDYDRLARKVPTAQLQEHLQNDHMFVEELIARCRAADIPIRASAEQIDGLLYAMFFTVLHEDDFGPGSLSAAIQLLLELIAAFCLGQTTVSTQPVTASTTSGNREQNHASTN
jgi:AcrR family transcriptional regulator